MYYYISDDVQSYNLNNACFYDINYELNKEKYSFSEILIIFNEKVKNISLIDLFCDEIYKNEELRFLANVIKNMRDTNKMYLYFEK